MSRERYAHPMLKRNFPASEQKKWRNFLETARQDPVKQRQQGKTITQPLKIFFL
jgi:hypothetical protein